MSYVSQSYRQINKPSKTKDIDITQNALRASLRMMPPAPMNMINVLETNTFNNRIIRLSNKSASNDPIKV